MELSRKIDDETPLTKEESRKVRLEMAALEEELNAKLFNKNLQINQLTTELNQIKKEGGAIVEGVPNIDDEEAISETQHTLLELIDRLRDDATHASLLEMTNQKDLRTEYDLEDLTRRGYLIKKYDQAKDDDLYKFTQLGRGVTLSRAEIPF